MPILGTARFYCSTDKSVTWETAWLDSKRINGVWKTKKNFKSFIVDQKIYEDAEKQCKDKGYMYAQPGMKEADWMLFETKEAPGKCVPGLVYCRTGK